MKHHHLRALFILGTVSLFSFFVVTFLLPQSTRDTSQDSRSRAAEGEACAPEKFTSTTGMSVWRPTVGLPEFTQRGKTFVAEVKATASLNAAQWCAWFENDLRSWPTSVTSATYGKINNGSQDGWRVLVNVPNTADFPPELMHLHVAHPSVGKVVSKAAVSVVPNLESKFYLLHITDEHVAQQTAPDSTGHESLDLVKWGIPVVNLINPRVVINTGDETKKYINSYTTTDPDPLFDWYSSAKQTMARFPSIIIPGNHDIPWDVGTQGRQKEMHQEAVPMWEKLIGQRSAVTRMGSFYILSHDYSDTDILNNWVKPEWTRAQGDTSIKYYLVAQHYRDWAAFMPPAGTKCDLMLIGHIHTTKNNTGDATSNCSRTIMTWGAYTSVRSGLLEFNKGSDGRWLSTNAVSYSTSSDNYELVGASGAPKVKDAYTNPNNGTQSTNTVTITNQLNRDFYEGRVRFLMARGVYGVTGGTILAQYQYDNGNKVAVDVQVNILKGTTSAPKTTSVSITKTAELPAITNAPTTTIPASPTAPISATPGNLSFTFTVKLHGIGNGGDNVNPNGTGNMNPSNPQRAFTVELLDVNDVVAKTVTGQLQYQASAGNFTATLNAGTVAPGFYTMRVATPKYLKLILPGIFNLPSSGPITVPQFELEAGDGNGDNSLNIVDYNILLDCFSELAAPKNCADAGKKAGTDFTDDGNVNQFDYNLFLRELSVQSGQ